MITSPTVRRLILRGKIMQVAKGWRRRANADLWIFGRTWIGHDKLSETTRKIDRDGDDRTDWRKIVGRDTKWSHSNTGVVSIVNQTLRDLAARQEPRPEFTAQFLFSSCFGR
jgi:hypothetical protein